MSFTGRANAGMTKLAKSMKNGVDNCKVDGKIVEQQKTIKRLTNEIGKLALVKLEAGEEMSPEIMERYFAIKEAKESIAALEKGRKGTSVVCSECGIKTIAGMKYCGGCGAELKEA